MAELKIDNNYQGVGGAMTSSEVIRSLLVEPATGRLEIVISNYIGVDTKNNQKIDNNYKPTDMAITDDGNDTVKPLRVWGQSGDLIIDVVFE